MTWTFSERNRTVEGTTATPWPASASATNVCGTPLSRTMCGRNRATRQAASKKLACPEITAQHEQRLARELRDVDRRPPLRSGPGCPHGQHADRKQGAALEPCSAERDTDGQVQRTLLQEIQQPDAAFFGELDLDPGAVAAVAFEEPGQDALHRLGRGADPKHSHAPAPQGTRSLAHRLRLRQHVAAVPQQVLALGRELDATADSIEEQDAELPLQVADLAREGRLAHMDALRGPRDALLLRNVDEIPEMAELHRGHLYL